MNTKTTVLEFLKLMAGDQYKENAEFKPYLEGEGKIIYYEPTGDFTVFLLDSHLIIVNDQQGSHWA